MTLKEAAKSKRPIRRKRCGNPRAWLFYSSDEDGGEWSGKIYIEDALAEDWEVRPLPEQKIEITQAQLTRAWDKTFYRTDKSEQTNYFKRFCKELGFDE